jgi:hypothetical protein
VRIVAAIPAAGLLAGAAAGLVFPDLPRTPSYASLILCATLAWWAWRTARPRSLASIVVVAFFIGGALLSADAWQRAWRPPLRIAFEDLARREREQAALEHRRLPEDDEAFAIVEGVLRADASPTESGVSLSVDVDGLEGREGRGTRSASLSGERLRNKERRAAAGHPGLTGDL